MNTSTQSTLSRQGLKTIMAALGATFSLAVGASAQKQPEDLYNFYESHGDSLFETLYYVPETRETVLKHIPEQFEWVGFELNEFEKFPAADKLALLTDVVTQLEQLDEDQQKVTIGRIRDWRIIRTQIGLFTGFLYNEPFFSLAFEDPLLKPVFQSYLDRRPANFNAAHIGESLSSGEHETIIPALVGKLLEAPASERFECFSRLYAEIAVYAEIAAIEAAKEKPDAS